VSDFFRRAAHLVTVWSGSWQFFLVSLLGIVLWALLGPTMGFSDTWQLIVNTPTTVLTYLLGILILLEANRQARESKVVHDELLRATEGARDRLINIDQMSDEEIERIEQQLRQRARRRSRTADEGDPNRASRKGRAQSGLRVDGRLRTS